MNRLKDGDKRDQVTFREEVDMHDGNSKGEGLYYFPLCLGKQGPRFILFTAVQRCLPLQHTHRKSLTKKYCNTKEVVGILGDGGQIVV